MMYESVKENLFRIQEEIVPCKPRIIAVTKYFGIDAMIAAYNCGIQDFAESRAIEAEKKINELPKVIKENSIFHFIGHLQTNKVKHVVGVFEYIHSVDSLKLAQCINEHAQSKGVVQKVLLQVNNAGEEQKFGLSRQDLFNVFGLMKDLKALNIVGLMNIAPLGLSDSQLKFLFDDIVNLRNELEMKFGCELKELSMGMSQDFKIAAYAGATMLRIGRKLFK